MGVKLVGGHSCLKYEDIIHNTRQTTPHNNRKNKYSPQRSRSILWLPGRLNPRLCRNVLLLLQDFSFILTPCCCQRRRRGSVRRTMFSLGEISSSSPAIGAASIVAALRAVSWCQPALPAAVGAVGARETTPLTLWRQTPVLPI